MAISFMKFHFRSFTKFHKISQNFNLKINIVSLKKYLNYANKVVTFMVAPPPRIKNRTLFQNVTIIVLAFQRKSLINWLFFVVGIPLPPLKSHIFQTVGIKQETLFAQLRYMILNNIPPDIKVNFKLLHFFVKPVLC